MGRPRKTAAQKKLEGTWRHDRNPVNEPEYSIAVVRKAPSILNRFGKRFWNEHYPMLINSGVLTEVDISAFTLMAKVWGDYMEANHDVFHDEDGKKRTLAEYRASRSHMRNQMSELVERKEYFEQFTKLQKEFGMTPVSRNKIDLGAKSDEVDPMESMLSGKLKAVK